VHALDRVVDDVLPLCLDGERTASNFHLDPRILTGATRYDVPHLLEWLGIPDDVLPYDSIYIHAGLEHRGRDLPAKLERRTPRGGEPTYHLYINNDLFISRPAVRAAIAHELTHLYLILRGHQGMHGQDDTVFGANDPEETRTEVAAMALGFGKLVLAGVEDYSTKVPGRTLGYITLSDFTYVYDRVNRIVGVSPRHAGRE
jgi:hypothetical protein